MITNHKVLRLTVAYCTKCPIILIDTIKRRNILIAFAIEIVNNLR